MVVPATRRMPGGKYYEADTLRYILIVLLLIIPSVVCAKPRFFSKMWTKTWTKTTGWCFSSKLRKVPKWLELYVCIPRRWGAADVCVLRKIKVNKNIHFMIGHKITYSRFRYEYIKNKKQWAHGPYVHFYMKL